MSRPQSTRPPVDEDVDDLDDVLEQFQPAQPKEAKKAPPSASAAAPPAESKAKDAAKPPIGIDDLDLSEDFARELAEGMAALMREIAVEASDGAGAAEGEDGTAGTGAGVGEKPLSEEERRREEAFRRAWEEMVVQAMDGEEGALSGLGGSSTGKEKGKEKVREGDVPRDGKKKGKEGEDHFQSSIKKAMEKLKESESNLHAESTEDDDTLEKLLKSFGDDGPPEDQMQGLLENMMTQLMSKDVLYEPLKELNDKFPAYMKEKATVLKAEDRTRFEGQQRVVRQVVAIFEGPGYTPENVEQNVRVVTLMNEMQSFGSPPSEIMGPLPPGLELGQDGLPKLPDGCTIA